MLVTDLGEFYYPGHMESLQRFVVVFVFATGSQFYSSRWLASLAPPVIR